MAWARLGMLNGWASGMVPLAAEAAALAIAAISGGMAVPEIGSSNLAWRRSSSTAASPVEAGPDASGAAAAPAAAEALGCESAAVTSLASSLASAAALAMASPIAASGAAAGGDSGVE